MQRRDLLGGLALVWIAAGRPGLAAPTRGQRLAEAAGAQVGVTTGYDPAWTHLPYPNGDVSRSTGVCADVVIRAARDGLGLDLQKLVHKDMVKDFNAYPARKAWGSKKPDASIDHRRVLNLEAYLDARRGAPLGVGSADPRRCFPRAHRSWRHCHLATGCPVATCRDRSHSQPAHSNCAQHWPRGRRDPDRGLLPASSGRALPLAGRLKRWLIYDQGHIPQHKPGVREYCSANGQAFRRPCR